MALNVSEVNKCRGCGEWPVLQIYTEGGKPYEGAILCPTGCATGGDILPIRWVVEAPRRKLDGAAR
jgi:hypothetical protein